MGQNLEWPQSVHLHLSVQVSRRKHWHYVATEDGTVLAVFRYTDDVFDALRDNNVRQVTIHTNRYNIPISLPDREQHT